MKQDQIIYDDIVKFQELKKFMEEQLEDYNMEPGIIAMDLVLFRDAIEHGEQSQEAKKPKSLEMQLILAELARCPCLFLFTSVSNSACDSPASGQHAAGGGWGQWPSEP